MTILSRNLLLILFLSFLACQPGAEKRRDRFFEKGRESYEAGKYVEARLELRKALRIDPNFAKGRYLFGLCFLQAEDWYQASRNLKRAVELDPGLLGAYQALSKLYPIIENYGKTGEKQEQMPFSESRQVEKDRQGIGKGKSVMQAAKPGSQILEPADQSFDFYLTEIFAANLFAASQNPKEGEDHEVSIIAAKESSVNRPELIIVFLIASGLVALIGFRNRYAKDD